MYLQIGLIAAAGACLASAATSATKTEMADARQWINRPAFSFTYGGRSSSELLKDWTFSETSRKLDKDRTRRELTWTDPQTGLVVRCDLVYYRYFPTVEWTLYFKNTGSTDTPIIENIQALDTTITRSEGDSEFVLHHFVGSPSSKNDYGPIDTPLGPGQSKRLGGTNGKATDSDWSYFNLQWGDRGAIVAVGWPGQWASTFTRDNAKGLRLAAGLELTHFKLHPGEEVRSPLIVVQTWRGDLARSYNIWRRWMLAHNVPKPGGKLPEPEMFGCSSHWTAEMTQANEQNQIEFIDRYLAEGVKINRWWMDAGWYPCDGNWFKTGTWEVDKTRFPNGLKAVCDYAHSKGLKTIVWFEPERALDGTWLTGNHPEWFLGEGTRMLNLGNPDALKWAIDHFSKILADEHIDLYRQDFNHFPIGQWRANDAPDRQGISEIKHCTGYLAYWDGLLARKPDMFIDACAGGGRRNDLETMRRAIPLWRTDFRCDAIGSQSHSYGIAHWLPYSGTGSLQDNPYDFRSQMVPFTNCLWDARRTDLDYDCLRRMSKQFHEIKKYWLGDYYTLTPYSTEDNVWMAWQFDCPEKGEGMVQAFRRPNASEESVSLKLRGLSAKTVYTIRNLDEAATTTATGAQLMKDGLPVKMPKKPDAAVIVYKKK